MTTEGLLNSTEALEVLGLYNPANKAKPNHRYLGWLAKRDLLKRIKLGPRTIVYDINDCKKLFEKAKKQGISLTAKPNNRV